MAAIVQRLERLIVVQDVVGSNPTSRPISLLHRSMPIAFQLEAAEDKLICIFYLLLSTVILDRKFFIAKVVGQGSISWAKILFLRSNF